MLDTHALIWAIYEPERLSARVAELLADGVNELLVSHAAVWELLNKVGRGKLMVAGVSVRDVYADIEALGVTFLPVTIENIVSAALLPHLHSDPFDRMFVTQALAEGLPLVTLDPEIRRYPVETIWD